MRGDEDVLNSNAKHQAADAIALETFISLNEAAAKQWKVQAEMAQSSEVKRLLTATAAAEQRIAADLRKLMPRVSS